MKKLFKRTLALLLMVVVAVTFLNMPVFAATKLSAPYVDISISSTSNPTLKLTWNEVEGANKYYIYRRETSSGSLKLIAKTSKLYYKDKGLTLNKTYYYKVKAYNLSNDKVVSMSNASNMVSMAVEKPDKPIVKAVAKSDSSIKISFNKVNNANRYYLYYSTSANGTYKSIGSTTGTTFTVNKLQSSTTYYFKVRAAKVVGNKAYMSDYSKVVSCKTKAKNGEFIVDFKKISNKEAGLPTGSAIVCSMMQMEYYGIEVDKDELVKAFNCSTNFYKKDGWNYGPHFYYEFVGDPTSNKQYAYGASYTLVNTTCRRYCKATNQYDKYNMVFEIDGYEETGPNSLREHIRKGNIVLALVDTDLENTPGFYIMAVEADRGGEFLYLLETDKKYVIICGYTDEGYIVYDPKSDKLETYNEKCINLFSAAIFLEK